MFGIDMISFRLGTFIVVTLAACGGGNDDSTGCLWPNGNFQVQVKPVDGTVCPGVNQPMPFFARLDGTPESIVQAVSIDGCSNTPISIESECVQYVTSECADYSVDFRAQPDDPGSAPTLSVHISKGSCDIAYLVVLVPTSNAGMRVSPTWGR